MKNLFTLSDLIRFAISFTALSFILASVGCTGGGEGGPSGPRIAPGSTGPVSTPGSDEDYLQGRWRKLGTYCGLAWTAASSDEFMEIDGTSYRNEIVTMCGATAVAIQLYALTYTDSVMTSQLVQSWQSGACPVSLQAVANAPVVNRNYFILGDELTITTGACAGGGVAQAIYEKE